MPVAARLADRAHSRTEWQPFARKVFPFVSKDIRWMGFGKAAAINAADGVAGAVRLRFVRGKLDI